MAFFHYMPWFAGKENGWCFPAMIGGAALLADGMITPPISVTSAIEGLKQIPVFSDITTFYDRIYCIGHFDGSFFCAAVWHCLHR